MTVARSTIIRGPAIITFNSGTFYTAGDIIVTPNLDLIDIVTSMFGRVDQRVNDIVIDITFTPTEYETAGLAALYPHQTPVIGASIFGATDKNVVIQTLAGVQLTYKAGAVTKIPTLSLSAGKPILGECTITCIGADNEAWSVSTHRVATASVAFSDTGFDPAGIITQAYTVVWGSVSPWSSIATQDGVTIDFDLSAEPVKTDSDGTVDMTIGNLAITARFIPVGVSEAQMIALLKMQDTGAARGASLTNNKNDLVVSGTGVHVTVYDAAPTAGPLMFGQTALRAGEVAMVHTAEFVAGARQAAYRVGTAAP